MIKLNRYDLLKENHNLCYKQEVQKLRFRVAIKIKRQKLTSTQFLLPYKFEMGESLACLKIF